jgi:hypothetical protein
MLLHFAESKLGVIPSAGVILEEIVEDIVVVIDLSLLLVKWMVLSCQGGQH